MGEMSEDIPEGAFCQVCGCLIEDMVDNNEGSLEYPLTCEDCQKEGFFA